MRPATVVVLAGVACMLLAACGSSGNGLIPLSSAGPLQSDFEAVNNAAHAASGDCGPTEAALRKTERDFAKLPRTIDASLHDRLAEGISNLRVQALALCAQPGSTTTNTTTSETITPPPTTTTSTTEENGGVPPPEEGESQKEPGTGGSSPENGGNGGGPATGGQAAP